MASVSELVARGRERLVAGGVPAHEAPGDAEVLARHALGWDLTQYAAGRRDTPPPAFETAYDTMLSRRIAREPVSQIVGHREFWGLDFEVNSDVLTPRPDTEFIVQAALDAAALSHTSAPSIVDIGTGSGCIAIALATELPRAEIIASDVSIAALNVARRNAARHGLSHRIAFLHSEDVPPGYQHLDIVVSNPPYIRDGQRTTLPPEVREFEPDEALYGGEDGLDFYRKLFANLPKELQAGGWLIVEVGYDQADAVRGLADSRHWTPGRIYSDLQGVERVLTFRLTENV